MSTPNQVPLAGGQTLTQNPVVDPGSGRPTFQFTKLIQDIQQRLQYGLDQLGQLIGDISPRAHIAGRVEPIGTTVQNIDSTGVVTADGIDLSRPYLNKTFANINGIAAPTQLPAATGTTQGAVLTTDFDAAGSAATAQSNAETFATAAANTAQTNAETYTDGKFTGAVGHTVTLAKITVGGANGSLTFNSNGLLTGFVDPT